MYAWATDLELVSKSSAKTNWYSYVESLPIGKVAYRNNWITNLKPTKQHIRELVEVGQHCCQIEDQAFDVLKNHGYHLEHNYGHRENRLFQAAMKKVGSEFKLWSDIRVLVSYVMWESWRGMLGHVLDYKHETGFESG